MLELIKSQRFQAEYKSYCARIEKISNDEIKKQSMLKLKTLAGEVKKLDSYHQEIFVGNQIPTGLADVRSRISAVRKQLETLLTDWEKQLPKV